MKNEVIDKLESVRALFARADASDVAIARFRECFPGVDDEILKTLVFHLYVDGQGAMLDMLWDLEMFLRGEHKSIDYGAVFHVIYHLYNYLLIEKLMPITMQDVIDELQEAQELLKEESPDLEGVAETLERLERLVKGATFPPDIER